MKDKIIIVTGGLGVLGRAVTALAQARGAHVAIIDAAPAPGADQEAFVQGGVDLTDAGAAQKAVDAVRARFGAVHGLANIAGTFRWQTLADGDIAAWDLLFRINLLTAVAVSKAALPALAESRGAIVNIGANGAVKAGAGMGPYAASKAGVAKLTESLAEEMKGKVRVNAVLPSIIDTPANRKDMPDADFSAWVTPEALAETILFLLSDAAQPITGALIPVTGGV
ncbi:MAG TPA: SDR family oxidoreductase [Caulobacterales bacterium]|jgi:NAD(P)-dependent dehydrogenase (short-subunit alcohol dehydrogenase family)|nr:SDR family oxidoreductase [Caulobacterales bacterium]